MNSMLKWIPLLMVAGLTAFGAFSSSSTYQLKSYSVGAGGTNSASSSTYKVQGSVGEQTNGTATGTNDTANTGSIQTEQINVPGVPTLSNGSGTYYNKLNIVIDTSSNPTDTTYDIAIQNSVDGYTTTSYVQADGTLNSTRVFQTYSAWGSSSGTLIVGLTPGVTYKAKVSAKQGLFTHTAYSGVATLATVALTLSFSVSPNSASLGSFVPDTIATSSSISFTFATNGGYGGSVYVDGQYGGFHSSSQSYNIPSVSANLAGQSQGIGIQVTNPSQSSGGPLTKVSPYGGTGSTVGAEAAAAFAQMLTSSAAITGGTASATVQVKASLSAPPATDYGEVFTFIASANY